jgi:hypothetical protein
MALTDYIPVFLFGAAALRLQFDLYKYMRKGVFALFAAGTINVFFAGFLKATWKLLYALGVCDFQPLNTLFLPLQSLGFLLAGLSLVLMLADRRKNVLLLAAAPPVFTGSFVFIGMMTLGLAAICVCLSVVAARVKKRPAAVLFALAFIGSMGMGYMSSRDSTSALVNWVEQDINTFSQCCMLGGALLLHRAGLGKVSLSRPKDFAVH